MITRPKQAPNDGEGYLASVSDLVSALIFVFIIMLAVFAYQLANVTEDLTAADETRDRILQDVADRLREAGIRVTVLYDQGVLRLSDNAINFPSGDETPAADHHGNVGRLARAVAEVVPCYVPQAPSASKSTDGEAAVPPTGPAVGAPPDRSYCQPPADPSAYACRKGEFPWLLETLLIEGHTDDVPVGRGARFRDNLELSSMRAATVHRMITACEPGMERLVNTDAYPVLSTSGYGAARPATRAPERAADNRRIDLRFLLEPPEGALAASESAIEAGVRERIGEGGEEP